MRCFEHLKGPLEWPHGAHGALGALAKARRRTAAGGGGGRSSPAAGGGAGCGGRREGWESCGKVMGKPWENHGFVSQNPPCLRWVH